MSNSASSSLTLEANYRLSLGIIVLSLPWVFLSPWITVALASFGVFLMIQTATLQLVFTPESLEIYRGQQQIRSFPYRDWLSWEIYIRPVPILFYFREVNSIHFLPILFNPSQLRTCLEGFVGDPALAIRTQTETPHSPSTVTPSSDLEESSSL